MTATVRTVDGRVAGRRGQATRARLLECLHEMLGTSPYRDVTVIDVARMAGTSPATFYQYFPDIEAAVIELATDMVRDGAELKELVGDRAWTGKAGFNNAETLVDGFLRFWQQHEAILRVVDLAASEGDKRFSRIRAKVLSTVAAALAESISGTQKAAAPARPAHTPPRACSCRCSPPSPRTSAGSTAGATSPRTSRRASPAWSTWA